MTSFSPAYNVAQDRASSIDQVRLVAQWASDLPGRVLAVHSSVSGPAQAHISDVDPSAVYDQYGPPQRVVTHEQVEVWTWLHPEGFEVLVAVPLGAA